MSPAPQFILASGSPRRRELLASLGIDFDVISPQVDEKSFPVQGLPPREKVLALAQFKGEAIAAAYPQKVVISADTLVALDGEILEKPIDEADAFQMLQKLQNNRHTVFSSIAVFYHHKMRVGAWETHVAMSPMTAAEIWAYIHTHEPMDKAGAYAIQGYGSLLVHQIEGCYFNVVGLSLNLLDQLCQEMGVSLKSAAWKQPLISP